MSTYRVEWSCCGSVTETESWEPEHCPFCHAPSQPDAAAVAEPVAWRTFDGEGGYDYRSYSDNENYAEEWRTRNPRHAGWVEPLYAAPPQREREPPLTDEQIDAIILRLMDTTGANLRNVARATERAHGIAPKEAP